MKSILIVALLMLALASAGCTINMIGASQGAGADTTRAWFDSPLPGTVFLPPNPCSIVGHGGSPAGIAMFELSINGAVTSIPSQDTKSSLATFTRDCGLTEPGEYHLRMRAQDNSGVWSGVAETSLIIQGGPTATPSPATVALTPSNTPKPAAAGGVSIQSISDDLIYVGDSSCGPVQVTIVAQASAPNGIQVVVLFYRFEPGSPKGFENVAMNPAGGDLYQVSLNPTSLLGGALGSDEATLQYQVVVQQKGGDTSIRTPVLADIAVQPCGGGGAAAPVDCTAYNKKSACESHGCNWVAVPAIVPLFACQNP